MIPVSSAGRSDDKLAAPAACHLVIGSYTEPYGAFRAIGDGVSLVRLGADGSLSLQDTLYLPNPSYLRPGGDGLVRAVLETNDDRAAVATIAVRDDRLTLLQTVPVTGRIPCHIDIHPAGKWLAIACYGSGDLMAWTLDHAGMIQPESASRVLRRGHSIHPVRQTSSHPHAVRFSPDGNWLIVPDLGTDEVASYRFDLESGLTGEPAQIWRPAPGSGPRLPVFSQDGRIVMLVNELTSRLTSLAWDNGVLRELDSISTLPAPFSGENTAAGLRLHPSGELVGVTNRGAHCVSLFRLDRSTGALSHGQAVPSGGDKPRDFAFSPCGRWMLVTNQDTDSLVLYALHLETARVEDTGQRLHIRSPSVAKVL